VIGGIVFGPRTRSFATKIQKKVYALAIRTAISYRYSKSQLKLTEPHFIELGKTAYLRELVRKLEWTRKAGGGTLFVTLRERANLFRAARKLSADVAVKSVEGVQVRDLLSRGRVIFEKNAFERLIQRYGAEQMHKKKRVNIMDPIERYRQLLKTL
jgi:large subunit ribosomal protein L4